MADSTKIVQLMNSMEVGYQLVLTRVGEGNFSYTIGPADQQVATVAGKAGRAPKVKKPVTAAYAEFMKRWGGLDDAAKMQEIMDHNVQFVATGIDGIDLMRGVQAYLAQLGISKH